MPNSRALESIFQLVHMLKREIHTHVEQLDVGISPMHVRMLKIIGNRPECTAMDIACFLKRDKAQVTRLLTLLIDKGLIKKIPNPEDKRSQHLIITEQGAEIYAQIRSVDQQIAEKINEDLSEQEIDAFCQTAEKMLRNLAEHK